MIDFLVGLLLGLIVGLCFRRSRAVRWSKAVPVLGGYECLETLRRAEKP